MTTVLDNAVGTTPAPATTVGFGNVLRSEWTKLRSVRSTYWTALAAALSTLAIGIIVCAQWVHEIDRHREQKDTLDAALTSLNGLYLAQVAVGALGVLVISSEYGTGMIRATLAAVPQRRTLLAAKLVVFSACTFILGEIISFVTFGICQAILHRGASGVSITDGAALRAVFGGGLYVTAIGLLGFGLGALIRHTAGALSALFGLLFATTALADLLPTSWRNTVIEYMPLNAGSQIITTQPSHDSLSPWQGIGVLFLYGIVALAGALALISRRDA
ncbi:MAG TPA: ABC transporter permease subunit [Jatrophihabitantaceae bacterium]|jgi:hypothetical protein|nr:ABC transporter permease subunit [Jatrophihabitantaceae bacterium]